MVSVNLICNSIDQFRLHTESTIRDASGAVVFAASALPLNESCALAGGKPDSLSPVNSIYAGPVEQKRRICFISNEKPDLALITVLQVASCGRSFCVVPTGTDETQLTASMPSDSSMEEYRSEPAQSGLPQFECLSSGTTGTARRIQRSHQSWINSFKVNASLMQIRIEDSYAIIGKLSHSLPLYAAMEACHLGADVHLLGELRPDRQLDAMARLGTTMLYLTPTQARQLCAVPISDSRPRFRVRHLLCGGGKLDDKTRAALKQLFEGAAIAEFYGASETSFITMSTEQTPTGSVGHAYPGVSVRIFDEHDELATGVGEIWVKSEYLFTGYASGAWRDTQRRDGYLSIGEMGRKDEAGHLFLSGRKSRQANVADNFVYLQEIEDVLLQHAAVHHCVVMARQEPLRGEVLIAAIEGSADASLRADILKYARQQLGPILAPRDILFLDALPFLSAGKPDIRLIQSMVAEGS